MKTNNLPTHPKNQKPVKHEPKSSQMMRIFSILMLLLMALTSFGRIASANHRPAPGGQAPVQLTVSSRGGSAAALVFVFHQENKGTGLCKDLVVTAGGAAIYSTCGKTIEKQYRLSEIERQQLLAWIKDYQVVNYDHRAGSQPDNALTHLYLNGQGSKTASDLEIQRMIEFAIALNTKIASQP